ncbi:MAG: hypothetical protein ABWZ82_06375 [Candidatus Limnocylindrales bacterium]
MTGPREATPPPVGSRILREAGRLVAVLLLVLWAALAVTIVVYYRPGGPWDVLVASAAFAPVAIAASAVIRPPLARVAHPDAWRANLIVAWVGLVAVLLVGALLVLEIRVIAQPGDQTLLPSLEVAYALVLALGSLSLYTAFGISEIPARPGARAQGRMLHAAGLAVIMTASAAFLLGVAALANDLALRDQPAGPSRFGPTDASVTPPTCDTPVRLGPSAEVAIDAQAIIDGESVGLASVQGVRDAYDESWSGSAEGDFVRARAEYARMGPEAWMGLGAAEPSPIEVDPFGMEGANGLTLDGPVVSLLTASDPEVVAEDLGVGLVSGARARHCRTAVDGTTALDTFLPLRWLAGSQLLTVTQPLDDWRGTLDWWVFTDGQLGQATVDIHGYPGEAWPTSGIAGTLSARLTALDRDVPQTVTPPGGA